MELVGKQIVDFTDNAGKRIQGIKLHILAEQNNVQGMAAITQFVNAQSPLYEKAYEIPYGSIEIVYGYRGAIQDIKVSE